MAMTGLKGKTAVISVTLLFSLYSNVQEIVHIQKSESKAHITVNGKVASFFRTKLIV
jgi:hypothetical protein